MRVLRYAPRTPAEDEKQLAAGVAGRQAEGQGRGGAWSTHLPPPAGPHRQAAKVAVAHVATMWPQVAATACPWVHTAPADRKARQGPAKGHQWQMQPAAVCVVMVATLASPGRHGQQGAAAGAAGAQARRRPYKRA